MHTKKKDSWTPRYESTDFGDKAGGGWAIKT